jgi:RNHCP domain-containing protein
LTYQPDDEREDELADGLTDERDAAWGADYADDGDTFGHVRARERRPKRERRRAAEPARNTGPSDEDEDWGSQARARPVVRRRRRDEPEEFRCRHCRVFVVSVPSGGKHRNHCPTCLHSRHVDERLPGDRLSTCGGTMAPIGRFQRAGGEDMLLHRCLDCGVERRNRIAADDDFDLVLTLPEIVPPGPGNDPASDLA